LRIWARGLSTQLREVESGFRLTNLDSERPTWLDRAHARLDQIARRRRAPARPGAGRAPLARPWKVIAVTAVWLRQLGDCALCASRVYTRHGTERGGYPDAIAALVLLATRYPVAQMQPRSQDAPGWAPGSRKGGWA
jgi:hypothetical protein